MVIRNLKKLLLAGAILPLLLQPASAHVVWFDYQNGEYNLLYGHPEEGPQPYSPAKLKEATAYDATRQIVPFTINQKQDGLSLTPDGDIAALTAFFDNGYYARISENESRNISEAEISQYQNVSHNLKYTKALYDWSDTLAQPFNQPLEIIPLENPFAVQEGDNLEVQVYYQGQPLSDVTVEYLGQEVSKDNNGIFSVPIGIGGLEQIEASYGFLSDGNLRISYESSFTAQKISVFEPSALLGLGVVGLLALRKKKNLA